MDLGSGQESSLTMPMPMLMQNFSSIHESSKCRMQLVGAPTMSNGTPVTHGSGAGIPVTRPPPPTPQPLSAAAAPANSTVRADLNANQVMGAVAPVPSEMAVSKRTLTYRECLKNHAANIGGHALDGCGEFMPSGEEGSLEALKCAACDCHRNFHRREIEGEAIVPSAAPGCGYCAYSPRPPPPQLHSLTKDNDNRRRFAALATIQPPHAPLPLPAPPSPSLAAPPRSLHMQPDDHHSPDLAANSHLHNSGAHPLLTAMHAHHPYHHFGSSMKKRFRTKFSSEQKDRMFDFAEKLGWRIQKHDETSVHQFCADVGVKRHVFKVWMHNNKNTFAKKILPSEGEQYFENAGSSPTTNSGMQS